MNADMLNRRTEDRPLPLSLSLSLSLSFYGGWGTSSPPSSGSATENDYSCHLCLCFNFWLRICYFKFWTPLLRSHTLWGSQFAALVKQILQQFYCSFLKRSFANILQQFYCSFLKRSFANIYTQALKYSSDGPSLPILAGLG